MRNTAALGFARLARLAVLVLGLAPAAHALDVGDPIPSFQLPGKGQEVSLSSPTGRVVYLDFWASWCGPCRHSFPWMNEMQEKYGAKGFQVIGVNLDAKAQDVERFLAKVPARFTLAFDPKGDTARLYGVKGMPSSVLIGRDGKVIALHKGFNEEGRLKLEAMIQAAVEAGK